MKITKYLLIAALLVCGCERARSISKPSGSSGSSTKPREVEFHVSLGGITHHNTVTLAAGENGGITSFSASESSGRDYAFSLTYQYVGSIDMPADGYSKQVEQGDVIAVRVSRTYPKKNDMTNSKVIFVTCDGAGDEIVDGDITIVWGYEGNNN